MSLIIKHLKHAQTGTVETEGGEQSNRNFQISKVIFCYSIFSAFKIKRQKKVQSKVIEYRSRIPDCVQCVTYCTSSVCSVTRRDVPYTSQSLGYIFTVSMVTK